MKETELTRREFLQAGLGMLAGAAVPPSLVTLSSLQAEGNVGPAGQPPNLVYILADQLRACSVGPYENSEVSTPHLDQLASQGALFTNAVTTSPMCSPHRGCLLTGRYPTATGVVNNDIKLPPTETCIAKVFRNARYRTGYIGKWHLDGPTPDPVADPGWVAPVDRQGFTTWIAFNLAHVYYDSKYYMDRDPTIHTIPSGVYEPDFQTDRAINYITANQDRRFCLFLSIGPPHQPHRGPDTPPGGDYTFPYNPSDLTLRPNVDYPDVDFARQKYADYYGIASNFDWNVGRIVNTVDSLGLANDTIIVVSADHGVSLGSHFSTYQQFLKKGRIEAEMLDVPFILRYPARVAPQVITDVFTSVDIMPTLLGFCKLSTPPGVMGRDFSPLLISGTQPVEPPYGPVPSTESALVAFFGSNWVGVRTMEYTLDCNGHTLQPTKLYHNTTDPYQMTNLVDDPAYTEIRDNLHQQLLVWLDYVGPAQRNCRAAAE